MKLQGFALDVENVPRAQASLVAKCVLTSNMPNTYRSIPPANISLSVAKPRDFAICVVRQPILAMSVVNLAEPRSAKKVCVAEWATCRCRFLNAIAMLASFVASR